MGEGQGEQCLRLCFWGRHRYKGASKPLASPLVPTGYSDTKTPRRHHATGQIHAWHHCCCSVVMSDSVTPWTAACQASWSFTLSWRLLTLMSTELMMPSNHPILCHPFSSCPPSFPALEKVFSNESVLRIRWPRYRTT